MVWNKKAKVMKALALQLNRVVCIIELWLFDNVMRETKSTFFGAIFVTQAYRESDGIEDILPSSSLWTNSFAKLSLSGQEDVVYGAHIQALLYWISQEVCV